MRVKGRPLLRYLPDIISEEDAESGRFLRQINPGHIADIFTEITIKCWKAVGDALQEWVIEVVSPSSVKMDYERKKKLNQGSGVEEYRIVDTEKEKVSVYRFQEDDRVKEYTFEEIVKVGIYENLNLDLREMKEYLEG